MNLLVETAEPSIEGSERRYSLVPRPSCAPGEERARGPGYEARLCIVQYPLTAHACYIIRMNPLCEVLLVIWLLFWIPITAVVRTVSLWLGLVKYKNVDGEVVVITGAGSGIGRLMALEFAKRNAIVALWDINEKENNLVAEEITRNGFKAHAYYCDCSKREDIYRAAKRVTDEVGEVTFLVNNAGIATGKNILDCPDNLIQKTIDINTMAHIWVFTNKM